jgi:hypothetical protein
MYEIEIEGHIRQLMTEELDGWIFIQQDNGTTLCTCNVADQSALVSIIRRFHNMGITIISVQKKTHSL